MVPPPPLHLMMRKLLRTTSNVETFSFDDIPPDREDGSRSWVHHALVLTGRLGRISAILLTPIWIGLALLAAWPWTGSRLSAGLGFAFFFTLDVLMLALLPVTQRSWGPVTPSLGGLALVRCALFWMAGTLMPAPAALGAVGLLNLALTALAAYATWVEPFRISLTEQVYHAPGSSGGTPVRVLHLSDIHFEHASLREKQLLNLIKAHPADLLLLTGDYMNLSSVYDPEAQQGVRDLLAQMAPLFPAGAYAVTGSPVVDREAIVPAVFAGLPIRWLDDEGMLVRVGPHSLWLVGVRCTYQLERDLHALEAQLITAPPAIPRLLLYHTPDLMPLVRGLGLDLYLCGHTHGGQIRLPFHGAVATSSRWGKRYEQGRYVEGGTLMYVSRGLGLEGLGAPRARLLAPPEVIVWHLFIDESPQCGKIKAGQVGA
jgi:uncharacterized protein